jgi:iron complex transport system substrate-binding protein
MRVEGWRTNLSAPLPNTQRIVSVGPSNTEILHALGLGSRIVAVDEWSDYPPRVKRLPRVGSDLRLDVGRVRPFAPDVVVISLHVPGMEDNIPRLEQAGLRYVAVGGLGLDGVWQDMRVLGRFLDREQRAESLIGRTQQRMAGVAARVTAIQSAKRPRVHWEWSAHPVVAGGRSWMTELIRLAGGENAYAELDLESVRLDAEAVARHQPEVAVACWCGARKPPTVARVRSLPRPGWAETPAVRDGRVAVFSEDLFGRPGPRLAEGLERLADLLHPPRG